jgi:flagellin
MSITRVNNNVSALNASRNLASNGGKLEKSLERLSSGLRINRAGDDAAGLAISEKMRAQVRGLSQASRNAQDGISLIQTAEGGLNEVHNILQRMRELAVQAANGTNTADDVASIDSEMDQLVSEIDRIVDQTSFNTKTLLDGDYASGTADIKIQVGANANETITLNIADMNTAEIGSVTTAARVNDIDVTAVGGASAAISILDDAIIDVSSGRANLGAVQNRLESSIANLGVSVENLTAAESRIRDADIAYETTQYTRNMILVQAGTSVLAQANTAPQSVLSLLG